MPQPTLAEVEQMFADRVRQYLAEPKRPESKTYLLIRHARAMAYADAILTLRGIDIDPDDVMNETRDELIDELTR